MKRGRGRGGPCGRPAAAGGNHKGFPNDAQPGEGEAVCLRMAAYKALICTLPPLV
jgi:hypothetical protein